MAFSLATPECTGVEPAERVYQYRTPRVDRRATVKDIGLPESLHPTTNARMYVVAADVAETATGIRWMQPSSAAPILQLRLDPKTGLPKTRPGAPGPWGPRLNEPRDPRMSEGQAPPAGRQPKAPGPGCRRDIPERRRDVNGDPWPQIEIERTLLCLCLVLELTLGPQARTDYSPQ